MKADLHIHSTGSDGRHSLDYLLESYSKKNFDVVAITDHYVISHSLRDDNVLKMKEERYNIKIIIGMEAVGEVNNEWIHLLCYFNKNSDFSEGIHKYLHGQTIFVKELNNKVKRIMKKNIDIPDIDYSLLDPYSYTPILMEVVKRTNLSLKEARGEFFTYMKGLGIPEEYKLTTEELIEEVHKSKGLVFMAHPLQFEDKTILKAIELGIDGLEAIYPSYNDTQREYLISLAKEYNILYSAGSDFHCSIVDNKKHGEIGSVALTNKCLYTTDTSCKSETRVLSLYLVTIIGIFKIANILFVILFDKGKLLYKFEIFSLSISNVNTSPYLSKSLLIISLNISAIINCLILYKSSFLSISIFTDSKKSLTTSSFKYFFILYTTF